MASVRALVRSGAVPRHRTVRTTGTGAHTGCLDVPHLPPAGCAAVESTRRHGGAHSHPVRFTVASTPLGWSLTVGSTPPGARPSTVPTE